MESIMKIAILGWGSLLWDKHREFDEQHYDWQPDGPYLKLEFSRISESRHGALTLVLDTKNGKDCQVSYTLSKRKNPDETINDLRRREGTTLKNIGFYFADNSRLQEGNIDIIKTIQQWASIKKFNFVIWTNLECNFKERSKFFLPFSIETAITHLQCLDKEGKAKAFEYISRAPAFVVTPLREVLEKQAWFHSSHNG